jgi:hypothetical protein
MALLLSATALVLAVRVFTEPKRVVFVGPLFLMAGSVFLPAHARFSEWGTEGQWEMYVWAAGILLITLAAISKLGLGPIFRSPRSLQAFLLTVIGSSVYGYVRGNDPSYVVRQLFGSLLLFAYFVFAREYADEALFLRRTRRYGAFLAFVFLAYYAAVFSEYGIHKEITSVGTQAGIFAILLAAQGGGKSWAVAGILFLVPLLLVWRHLIVAFPLALVVFWAITAKSRLQRWVCTALACGLLVASLVPPVVGIILDAAVGNATVDQLLPVGARDSSSIVDRGEQLVEAGITAEASPLFGSGMGSSFEWTSVWRGDWEQAYVDNGWAYLLTKMGFVGLLSFLWFAAGLIRRMGAAASGLSACLLTLLLFVMWSEPVFFQFTTSPFAGVLAGLLWARKPEVSTALPVETPPANRVQKLRVSDAHC